MFDLDMVAYQALPTGHVDAVVDDTPIARYSAQRLYVSEPLGGTEAAYGMLFRKGDDALRVAVNQQLEHMQRDGTYVSHV